MKKRRRFVSIFKNLLLAAIALLTVATATEIALRTLNSRHAERKLAEHGTGERAALSFDSLLAGGEIASGAPFVFVAGDSVTFGYNIKTFRHAYPFLLDQSLRAARAPMRVATASLPGGNTMNELSSFVELLNEHRGIVVKPRFAVVGYCLNDAEGEHDYGLRGLVTTAAFKLKKDLTQSFYRREPETVARGFDGIARLAKERDFPVLVTIFPYFIPMESYPYAKAHKMVADMARARGLLALDLLPAYRAFPADALSASTGGDRVHPSPLAHKIAADAIFIEAVRRGWIEGVDIESLMRTATPAGPGDARRLCGELSEGEAENRLASCLPVAEGAARGGRLVKWRPPGGIEVMLFTHRGK